MPGGSSAFWAGDFFRVHDTSASLSFPFMSMIVSMQLVGLVQAVRVHAAPVHETLHIPGAWSPVHVSLCLFMLLVGSFQVSLFMLLVWGITDAPVPLDVVVATRWVSVIREFESVETCDSAVFEPGAERLLSF